jgi:hypothetical protein
VAVTLAAFVLAAASTGAAFAVYDYNAPPVTPDFSIGPTTVLLTERCAPDRVARHLISRLDAFDSGRARAFSRAFPARSAASARQVFNPYSGEALPGYRSSLKLRPTIERVARALYRRGDGWTATRLLPPQGILSRNEAIYGLSLRVTRRGVPSYDTGVKVIIDCATGRVKRWNGPVGSSSRS